VPIVERVFAQPKKTVYEVRGAGEPSR
jgi:hypothetical protein